MKKIIAISLLTCILFASLAGCDVINPTPDDSSAGNSDMKLNPAAAGENEESETSVSEETDLTEEVFIPNGPDHFDDPYEDRIYNAYQYIKVLAIPNIWDKKYKEKLNLSYDEARETYIEYAKENGGYEIENRVKFFNYADPDRPESVEAYL